MTVLTSSPPRLTEAPPPESEAEYYEDWAEPDPDAEAEAAARMSNGLCRALDSLEDLASSVGDHRTASHLARARAGFIRATSDGRIVMD